MFEVGQVCIKMAGRDAGQKCVIVEVLEGKYVLVDGMTRRRKCNTLHLEPINQKLDIKKNAAHEEVVEAFKGLNHHIRHRKPKAKTEKPRKISKKAVKKEAKTGKATTQKEKNINKK